MKITVKGSSNSGIFFKVNVISFQRCHMFSDDRGYAICCYLTENHAGIQSSNYPQPSVPGRKCARAVALF